MGDCGDVVLMGGCRRQWWWLRKKIVWLLTMPNQMSVFAVWEGGRENKLYLLMAICPYRAAWSSGNIACSIM